MFKNFKLGIRLVRSNRSNPALKQGLKKARFLKKEYYPTNIFSEGGQTGVEIVFAKQNASRNAMKVQTLLLAKPVKKFASDKDEGVFV
jgi:hypothetical protein